MWFLGTYVRIRLEGAATAGRLGAFEGVFPENIHAAFSLFREH